MTRGIIALVFRCKITGGDLRASDETTAFRWATEADIADLADEAYAVRILDAFHDEHPPVIRQHDGVHLLKPGTTRHTAALRTTLRQSPRCVAELSLS
jgi:hypothetical protein